MGQAPADCSAFNCKAMSNMIEKTNDAQQVVAKTINESAENLINQFAYVQRVLQDFVTEMAHHVKDTDGSMSLLQSEYQMESKRQQNQSDTMQTAVKAENTELTALGDAAQQSSSAYATVMGYLKLVASLISSPMS